MNRNAGIHNPKIVYPHTVAGVVIALKHFLYVV